MVHIDEAVKLDFKDVLIRPKRSTLKSRSQVRSLCMVSQGGLLNPGGDALGICTAGSAQADCTTVEPDLQARCFFA